MLVAIIVESRLRFLAVRVNRLRLQVANRIRMPSAKLQELRLLVGPEQASVLLNRLAGELSSSARDLDACKHTPSLAARHAHKLVAIAGALGLGDLADRFADIETICRSGGSNAQGKALPAIEAAVAEAGCHARMIENEPA